MRPIYFHPCFIESKRRLKKTNLHYSGDVRIMMIFFITKTCYTFAFKMMGSLWSRDMDNVSHYMLLFSLEILSQLIKHYYLSFLLQIFKSLLQVVTLYIRYYNWRLPSLSELTPMIFYMG